VVNKDFASEVMGTLAFAFIAGFGGLSLAVVIASFFVAEVTPSNFQPYAAAGFLLGAPVGLVGYRLRERFLERTLEVQ